MKKLCGKSRECRRSAAGWRLLLLLLSALLLSAVVGPVGTWNSNSVIAGKVQAASKKKVKKIAFTDQTGWYLQQSGKKWYLKDKNGKAVSGLQHVMIRSSYGLTSGWYMFGSKGLLIQKKAVYSFKNQKKGGLVWNGFYYTNGKGCFVKKAQGLTKLSGLKCAGKKFSGYYYVNAYGKLTAQAQVRYLSAKKIGKVRFAKGYYYFDGNGKLYTKKIFRTLNQKVGKVLLKGTYYFGDSNGRLRTKKGWVTYKNKKYYIDSKGKKQTNCWKSGYYLKADGTIAKRMQVPDGSYVDGDGRKCSKEEMAMGSLKTQLQKMIRGYSGSWSVYVKDLKTGDVLIINDRAMYPASTIKAFVMASTYNQIKNKKLKETATVKRLLNSMITISDNESYNQLVRYQTSSRSFVSGAAVVNKYLKKNGYTKTACHHTLHPAYSSHAGDGGSNRASAKDCGVLLERIYKGTCVSKEYSKKMLNLLLKQQRRYKIPAGVPKGIKVANKTGETSTTQHDIAIVYGKKTDYVVCVFSSGVGYAGANNITKISSKVYHYLND